MYVSSYDFSSLESFQCWYIIGVCVIVLLCRWIHGCFPSRTCWLELHVAGNRRIFICLIFQVLCFAFGFFIFSWKCVEIVNVGAPMYSIDLFGRLNFWFCFGLRSSWFSRSGWCMKDSEYASKALSASSSSNHLEWSWDFRWYDITKGVGCTSNELRLLVTCI